MALTPYSTPATDAEQHAELTRAVHRYFDLMYDCDTAAFDAVFAPTVQLHGWRDGRFVIWPASTYKEILQERQSPKSLGAERVDEILLLDVVSDAMALSKVRLRIAARAFVDFLIWHRFDSGWRITSKGFHLEAASGQEAS